MKNLINMETVKDGKPSINMTVFYLVLIGQCVSYIGSGIMCFGQAVWIYTDLGGTITHLSLITVAAHLPGMLLSPFAGVLADRYDRRMIMIVCDATAALATLLLRVLIVTHSFQLWHIYLITAIIGMANRFQWPAYISTVPQIVPPRHLARANGMVSTAQSIGFLTAPVLAGFLITVFKIQGIILFDLSTFLFAFVTLMMVRFPKVERNTHEIKTSNMFKDLKEGFAHIKKITGLSSLMLIMAVSQMTGGIVGTLFLPMLLGVTSAAVGGTIISLGGVGAIAGGIYVSLLGGPRNRIKGILGFMVIAGISLIVGGIQPLIPLFCIAIFLFNFCSPVLQSCNNVIVMKKTTDNIRGRILSIQAMVYSLTLHFGLLIAGPVTDKFFEPAMAGEGLFTTTIGRIIGTGKGRGIALLILLLGILLFITAAGGYLKKKIRYIEINNKNFINEDDTSIASAGHYSYEQ